LLVKTALYHFKLAQAFYYLINLRLRIRTRNTAQQEAAEQQH
jgi:hypothetical protein